MRTKYRQWAVDYLTEHPEVVFEQIDFNNPFFLDKPFRMEIGSGKGDFIVEMAKKNPDINFLGVERVPTIAGMMVKKIVEEGISNVKVFANDINIIYEEIKDGSVDGIYLNFVDPWPKKRHAKRRLTFINCLNQYYRILKKDGLVIFKSDNDGLFEFTNEELTKTKFKVLVSEEKYEFDSTKDAMTEYETKYRLKGLNIHRIIFEK